MNAIASQITGFSVVYSIVVSDANQRKHQSPASQAFVLGIHRWPVNSPHNRTVRREMFPFNDVIRACVLLCFVLFIFMMTSSNGNIFRVTGPLCGEFTGPGEFPTQRPVTRSFDVFFDLLLNKRLSKQPWGWWFETLSWSLWRHCNVLFIYTYSSVWLHVYLGNRSIIAQLPPR